MRHRNFVATLNKTKCTSFVVYSDRFSDIRIAVTENTEKLSDTLSEKAEDERLGEGSFNKLGEGFRCQGRFEASGLRDCVCALPCTRFYHDTSPIRDADQAACPAAQPICCDTLSA
jgi:hypothetical protein